VGSKLSFSFVVPIIRSEGNEMARLLLLIAIVAFLVAGCAALENQFSGRGVITSEKSQTDGSEVVEVSGNNVLSNGGMSSFGGAMLGARWESITPEIVYIAVTYASSANGEPIIIEFDELRINVNGSVSTFRPLEPGIVSMRLAYLESMLAANECTVQLVRGGTITEGDFAIESDAGKRTAKASLQRFYDKVRATKAERLTKQI
jgi:hypothetical protein